MTNRVDGIVFDISGTVERGKKVLPGVLDTLAELRRRDIRFAFFTNDNSNPISLCVERLAALGITVKPEEVLSSALIAAEVVCELYPNSKILPIGGPGLMEAMQDRNLNLLDLNQADEAEVVVMGKDVGFNQKRLNIVCQAIWNGAKFLATNIDPKIPTANGFEPATGPMVKAVAYATGCEPLITGKPSHWSGKMAMKILNIAPERGAVIGDFLDTDIAMGKSAGIFSILVLTGVSTREQVDAAPDNMKPDLVLPDVNQLINWLNEG
ncbi:MAG: HAD-IIA family hydrolase [Gammaproteobacteria bacterium]